MNQATAITLIAINGAGLILSIGVFATAFIMAKRAKKDIDAKLAKAEEIKRETAEFLRRIAAI